MAEVRLEINNGTDWLPIDLADGETIAYTARFNDIKNFEAVGNFSRDFRIPASDTNMTVFGDIHNVNKTGGWFDFRIKTPARLSVDTILIAEGHIQIRKTYRANDRFTEFESVFYAEMPNLAKTIGEKKLADLANLSTLNTVLEYVSLTDSIDLSLESGNVIYALIDRGQNFGEQGVAGTHPVYSEDAPLYIGDFTPCVNGLWLWQQIFGDAGFYYEGADLDTELAKYWVPWLSAKYSKSTLTPQGQLFRLGLDTDLTTIVFPEDIDSEFDEQWDVGTNVAAGVFTAPYTGYFTFRAWAHFKRTSGSGVSPQTFIRLIKNGTDDVVHAGDQSIISSNNVVHQIVAQGEVLLQQGDTVFMRMTGDLTNQFTIIGDAGYDPNIGTGFELMSCSDPIQDATVDMGLTAPDMRQVDFIRSIIQMHNLILVPDKTAPNKLIVQPLGDYINSGVNLDWSQKLDMSKDVAISPTTTLQAKTLEWSYAEDSDYLNKLYKETGGRVYGSIRFDDTGNDFAQGEQKTTLSFAPTPCSPIPGTNIIIPKFISSTGEFVLSKPRILYYAGTATGVKVYDFDADDVLDTEVIMLSHYEIVDAEVDTLDLNFGMEVPQYGIPGTPYQTLYNRYWRNYIREIYGGLGTGDLFNAPFIMEAYFYLTTADIYLTTFADQIWIVDSWWRILEITDHVIGGNQVTKVMLMKKLDIQLECEYTPGASGTGGQIIFLEGDGITTSNGSEACCEKYGYVWDASKSKCFSASMGGSQPQPSLPVGLDSGFNNGGSQQMMIETINADYTVQEKDYTIVIDASGGNVTVTLPTIEKKIGRVLKFKRDDASGNTVTIDGSGSENIDNATTKTLAAREGMEIQNTGTKWVITAYKA